MSRLNALLSEDTNQFGPGTDLTIALLALLMVMTFITSYLYRQEKKRVDDLTHDGGNFKLAADSFSAADFYVRPVTKLVDPRRTVDRVSRIVADYRASENNFPYLFVIGHSNEIDDPTAKDKSESARHQRNWEYAARRATLIAGLMEAHLRLEEKERLVVVTTGEFDLKVPADPHSQENAWVEVVFGKEWKRPQSGHARE